MPCEHEILGRDSTRGIESYASIKCQNFNYDIGGKSTGGIGRKSQELALHTVIPNYGRIPILGVYS